jgi:hypothetical protein
MLENNNIFIMNYQVVKLLSTKLFLLLKKLSDKVSTVSSGTPICDPEKKLKS